MSEAEDFMRFDITEDIKIAMEERGETNNTLADKAGLSPITIRLFLSGDADISVSMLINICLALNVKLKIDRSEL